MDKREGEFYDFLSKKICLTVPKNFVGEPFSLPLISGIERFYASESFCHDFVSKFFCLTVPKSSVEEPFWPVSQKMSGSEKVYA